MNKKILLKETLSFFWIIGIIVIIRVLLIDISFVPTGSMQFSILPGDYILSTRYSYGYSNASIPFEPNIFESRVFSTSPNRGDIIIIKLKNLDYKIVKRLIAFPGEKIEIRDNTTYINDIPIDRVLMESFTDKSNVRYSKYKETLPNAVEFCSYNVEQELFKNHSDFGPFYIPEGHYFFLGDNRDNSADSRSFLGFVPFEAFVSKAQYILISNGEVLKRDSDNLWNAFTRIPIWFQNFRTQRFFKHLY